VDNMHKRGARGRRVTVVAVAAAAVAAAAPSAFASATTPVTQISVPNATPFDQGSEYLAMSHDRSRAYVIGTSAVSVLSTKTNSVVGTIALPAGGYPTEIAVNKAGTVGYVTDSGLNAVQVVDLTTNTVTASIPVYAAGGIAVSSDGTKVLVSGNGWATFISTATNAVIATVNVAASGSFGDIVVSGARAYVPFYSSDASVPGFTDVISTATGAVIGQIQDSGQVAVSPDGKTVYVSNVSGSSGATSLDVYSAATYAKTNSVSLPTYDHAIAVTPDGNYVYALSDGGEADIVSTSSLTIVDSTPLPGDSDVNGIGFTGTSLYYADEGNGIVDMMPLLSSIRSVTPNSAPAAGGATVTITGDRFSGATAVTFDGVAATSFKVVNGTTITAVVPAGAVGSAQIAVTTVAGTSAPVAFTFTP
jgi:YVTN family beta-propeller protein